MKHYTPIPIVIHLPLLPVELCMPQKHFAQFEPLIEKLGGEIPGSKLLLTLYHDRDGSLFVIRKKRTITFVGATASGPRASKELWWALSSLHGGRRVKGPATTPWIGVSRPYPDLMTSSERQAVGKFAGPFLVALLRYHLERKARVSRNGAPNIP